MFSLRDIICKKEKEKVVQKVSILDLKFNPEHAMERKNALEGTNAVSATRKVRVNKMKELYKKADTYPSRIKEDAQGENEDIEDALNEKGFVR